MQDLYMVLGISPDATQTEIRRRYHQLAREYHTDITLHPPMWAEEQLKLINGAYEVLRDPLKRAAYDAIIRPIPQPPLADAAEESNTAFWLKWWKVA